MTWQQTIIIGNVGRDAEMRYTAQGVAVTNFTVAVNEVFGKGEDRKEKTTWFKVSVWRERAEIANQYVKKGMRIMVAGKVSAHAYIDSHGDAASSLELNADSFQFLSRPADGATGNESRASADIDEKEIPF